MRIALVSPYSWNFSGGVNRHVDALARELLAADNDVRVLAPVDPDDALTRALHRSRPRAGALPDHLVPLGRTIALPMNGAVSRLCVRPEGVVRARRELRSGKFDVVHVHEPIVPLLSWDTAWSSGAPVVGTFHTYSTSWAPNTIARAIGARRMLNKLHARIAVSEAARWTGERFFGGEYEVIPNGVDLQAAPTGPKPPSDRLRIVFVGREEERKGLPVLLSAFAGLRKHVPAQLDVIGADPGAVEPMLAGVEGGMEGVSLSGHVADDELWRRLHAADVLCAPSLGGESFGMILTEAFAAGTPVVASDIAGYRDVVTHGRDGLLVPHGRPLELAEALRSLWLDPRGREEMSNAARERATDFAWPEVSRRVTRTYERALDAPVPRSAAERAAVKIGWRSADLSEPRPPRRLPSIEPRPLERTRRERVTSVARRLALSLTALLGLLLAALAFNKIGAQSVVETLVQSSPSWILIALGLFSVSMFLRSMSWFHIIRSALPDRPLKRRTVFTGTVIGVLMSATLPARLGEPARALVVSRRVGRMSETLPVIVGTLVSQTLLNLFALLLLAMVVLGSTDLLRGHEGALAVVSAAPLALALGALVLPSLLERRALGTGKGTVGHLLHESVAALVRLRKGLAVFRAPKRAFWAITAQLSAWGLQLLGAYALLLALGLEGRTDVGTAAAVLFAVNVTAVLPATPSNVGVFQLAVITVLSGVYGVPTAAALGYGLILQAVEVMTAVGFGLPALIREGVSWRDVRTRALAATPVELSPRVEPSPERV
ncbi:MAG: glycosyltransferase [Solirubrobacterales bacterium]